MLIVLAIILVLFYFLSKDNKEKIPLMKRENKHKMRDKNAINELNFTKIEKNILQESIRLNPQSAVEAAKEKKDILGLFEERIIFS